MSKPPTRKVTTQLGWRLRADLISAFKRQCADERKDPVLELEFLIEGALKKKTPGSGSGGQGDPTEPTEGDIIDESGKNGGKFHAPRAMRRDVARGKSSLR